MKTSKKPGKSTDATSNKQIRITALTLLKNYYDEQIFKILIRDFYNSDLDISLAAINASASLGNEVAVPRLNEIMWKGKPVQQVAAIRSLAQIKAPSSVEELAKYFTVNQDSEIRRELLRSITMISPMHPKTTELTRALLQDSAVGQEYYDILLPAVLEAGDHELVKNNLSKANPDVQRLVFTELLNASSEEAKSFIEFFRDKMHQLDPHTLGCFLCTYELKFPNPQTTFVIDTLQSIDPRATTSFLIALSGYQGRVENPQHIYRLLLRMPYVDIDSERLVGEFLGRIMEEVKKESPLLMSEFLFTTATNLEAVFAKLKNQYVSLKGIKEKDTLLAVVFTKILEQYATPEILKETQNYFKIDSATDPATITGKLRERMIAAPKDDKNRFDVCLRLFKADNRVARLSIYQILSRANLNTPALARRLNRLIRIVGGLEIRNSGKKILEILQFARAERISFLEETCVVTLCQLLNRTAIEQAKEVFSETGKYPHSLRGYIRGDQFVPPKFFINPLLKLLLHPKTSGSIRALTVSSLKTMNLSGIKGTLPLLIRALAFKEIEGTIKEDIAAILTNHGDSILFQPLVDLTRNTDGTVRCLGVRILKELAKRDKNISIDVMTNRLYLLLEDSVRSVQIEALLALLALEDDFAVQILDDYISGKDEAACVEILKNLDQGVSHELIVKILKLIYVDSKKVHEELRRVLPPFCQGPLAENIRTSLLEVLTADGSTVAAGTSAQPASIPSVGVMEKAKLDFKLRRENAQVLTVFFTDIVRFTEKISEAKATALDLMELIQGFEGITLPTIDRFKGTVIKKMGDGLLAVFKHPLNAAIAALEIQKQIKAYNEFRMEEERFFVRIGLNTGRVIRKEGDIFGDTVNVASRMETSASPGDIYLTQDTFDEIKEYIRCTELGPLQLKGKAEAITAYSAQEILIDIDKIISESQVSEKTARSGSDAGSLLNLKESMFKPEFVVPDNAKRKEELLFSALLDLFEDLSGAVEKLSEDYHDEYIFKHYLHVKWNEIVKTIGQDVDDTPPAAAAATV
jgi:class 3 adenylate cyclase/HEAT repeat protein